MLYRILKNTAFGFVFELVNDGSYFAPSSYEIYLNGKLHGASDKNVVAVFSLRGDTDYHVLLKGLGEDINFSLRTRKPSYVVDVKNYNAKGDGVACDTSAINAAIYSAAAGATVRIPPGIYIVDQVFLKSGVDIYIEKGAILKQTPDRNKLAVLKGLEKSYDHSEKYVNVSWEGHHLDSYCSLIYGKNVENVHIYGEGIIDGSGKESGFLESPEVRDVAFRPGNVLISESNNISITGITSRNSASWNVNSFYSAGMVFIAMDIQSAETSPNSDGLNPESCCDVLIAGCRVSVGDDCIAIKAGEHCMSTAHYRPSKNISVRNCYIEKGRCGVVSG